MAILDVAILELYGVKKLEIQQDWHWLGMLILTQPPTGDMVLYYGLYFGDQAPSRVQLMPAPPPPPTRASMLLIHCHHQPDAWSDVWALCLNIESKYFFICVNNGFDINRICKKKIICISQFFVEGQGRREIIFHRRVWKLLWVLVGKNIAQQHQNGGIPSARAGISRSFARSQDVHF